MHYSTFRNNFWFLDIYIIRIVKCNSKSFDLSKMFDADGSLRETENIPFAWEICQE